MYSCSALLQLYIIISSLAKFIGVLYMETSQETGNSFNSMTMNDVSNISAWWIIW